MYQQNIHGKTNYAYLKCTPQQIQHCMPSTPSLKCLIMMMKTDPWILELQISTQLAIATAAEGSLEGRSCMLYLHSSVIPPIQYYIKCVTFDYMFLHCFVTSLISFGPVLGHQHSLMVTFID